MKKELSPSFKITNEILNFVYEIGELVGKISAEKEFEKNLYAGYPHIHFFGSYKFIEEVF